MKQNLLFAIYTRTCFFAAGAITMWLHNELQSERRDYLMLPTVEDHREARPVELASAHFVCTTRFSADRAAELMEQCRRGGAKPINYGDEIDCMEGIVDGFGKGLIYRNFAEDELDASRTVVELRHTNHGMGFIREGEPGRILGYTPKP